MFTDAQANSASGETPPCFRPSPINAGVKAPLIYIFKKVHNQRQLIRRFALWNNITTIPPKEKNKGIVCPSALATRQDLKNDHIGVTYRTHI